MTDFPPLENKKGSYQDGSLRSIICTPANVSVLFLWTKLPQLPTNMIQLYLFDSFLQLPSASSEFSILSTTLHSFLFLNCSWTILFSFCVIIDDVTCHPPVICPSIVIYPTSHGSQVFHGISCSSFTVSIGAGYRHGGLGRHHHAHLLPCFQWGKAWVSQSRSCNGTRMICTGFKLPFLCGSLTPCSNFPCHLPPFRLIFCLILLAPLPLPCLPAGCMR